MKKILIFLISLTFFLPAVTQGEENYGDIVRYQYNPIEDWWKTTPNKSSIKYNPMTNEWQYAYPGQVLKFNPAEDAWEYAEPEKEIRYDLSKEKWFFYQLPAKAKKETKPTLTSTSPVD